MWLSLNIISDMVDISGIEPRDIALRLTMSTAEIDGIDYQNQHFNKIYTARILDVTKHPNADSLTVVDCDLGDRRLQVVCGAPNHKKGDIVALATVGTRFTPEFEVQKRSLRGVESSGMLCSEKELGLSDDHSGIMVFDPETPVGIPLSGIFQEWVDVRLEIDNKSITHRPDLWSHVGFAREIAALFGRPFAHPVDFDLKNEFEQREDLKVTIVSPDVSPRYCGLWIKNIAIAPSPDWLKARVTAIGMRPINNIVDITNYVMAEIGEPMHAFDRFKLRGNEIIVRPARDGEPLTTLDGQEHTLIPEDVVIADQGGAVALAGVMGGGNSEIDDATTEIVLEAANFNPVNIRKTAARYNLRTEAAIRFEKSLDPEGCEAAIIRCYELIKRIIPSAEAVTGIVDAYPKKIKKNRIATDLPFIRQKLGNHLDDARIVSILESLNFSVARDGDSLSIEAPTERSTKDVSIPADIVEEVGRIYGYDNIDPRPPLVPCEAPLKNALRLFERQVKTIMVRDHHFIEVSNYSFINGQLLDKLGENHDRELRLKNPLSQDHDRLRRSLLPGICKNIAYNERHQESFRIMELGRVYLKEERMSSALATEVIRLTGAVYAKKTSSPLFYEARHAIADLLDQLALRTVSFAPEESLPGYMHPVRSIAVRVDKKIAGHIFELHPKIRREFEIAGSAALFDLDLSMLFTSDRREPAFRDLQRFPAVPFEMSVIAGSRDYAETIVGIIKKAGGALLDAIEVLDVYEGAPIPEGKKSVSIRAIFAAPDRTLSPDEIQKLQGGVIGALNKQGYQLR